ARLCGRRHRGSPVPRLVRLAPPGLEFPHPGRRSVRGGGDAHFVPARRVRRASAQSLGHHLPRGHEPLDRRPADRVLLDHAAVLRPALLVRGTREPDDRLADMKRQKNHLANVLDELGDTPGLVNMEDRLQEIVRQIYDEYVRPTGETYTVPQASPPVQSGAIPL